MYGVASELRVRLSSVRKHLFPHRSFAAPKIVQPRQRRFYELQFHVSGFAPVFAVANSSGFSQPKIYHGERSDLVDHFALLLPSFRMCCLFCREAARRKLVSMLASPGILDGKSKFPASRLR